MQNYLQIESVGLRVSSVNRSKSGNNLKGDNTDTDYIGPRGEVIKAYDAAAAAAHETMKTEAFHAQQKLDLYNAKRMNCCKPKKC